MACRAACRQPAQRRRRRRPSPTPSRPHCRPRSPAPRCRQPAARRSGPSVTATTAAGQGGPAAADLYPVQAGTSAGGTAARTIRSPAAFALPGSLELGRSLRPLKRRVPSRSHLVLDEAATAHHIADTGDWTPVFNPAPERWFDVLLVVDESSSMVIWQRTIAELEKPARAPGRLPQRRDAGLPREPGQHRHPDLLGHRPCGRSGPHPPAGRADRSAGPAFDRRRQRLRVAGLA